VHKHGEPKDKRTKAEKCCQQLFSAHGLTINSYNS